MKDSSKKSSTKNSKQKNLPSEEEEKNVFLEYLSRMPEDPEYIKKLHSKTQNHPKKVEDSKPKNLNLKLDLHGKTLTEAMFAVDAFFNELKIHGTAKTGAEITIVTGRGLRSSEGPVLATSIYEYVKNKYQNLVQFLDGSPGDLLLKDGTAFKGNFRIRFK